MPDSDASTTVVSRRRAQTRERLLAAARTTFAERGVYGATVEDICEEAGFTRGAFYSNFASKDDLYFAVLEQEESERLARVEQVFASGPLDLAAGGDVLDELVRRVLATQPADRQWYLMHTEFSLYAIRNPEIAERLVQAGEVFRNRVSALVEAGIALAGRRLTISADDAVIVLMSVYEGAVRDQVMSGPAGDADSVPERAVRTWPTLIRGFSEPASG